MSSGSFDYCTKCFSPSHRARRCPFETQSNISTHVPSSAQSSPQKKQRPPPAHGGKGGGGQSDRSTDSQSQRKSLLKTDIQTFFIKMVPNIPHVRQWVNVMTRLVYLCMSETQQNLKKKIQSLSDEKRDKFKEFKDIKIKLDDTRKEQQLMLIVQKFVTMCSPNRQVQYSQDTLNTLKELVQVLFPESQSQQQSQQQSQSQSQQQSQSQPSGTNKRTRYAMSGGGGS